MLIQNTYTYIQIGLAIRLLRNVGPRVTKQFVEESIAYLNNGLKAGGFEVTLQAMAYDKYIGMIADIEALEDNGTAIGEPLAREMAFQYGNIETVIFPEASIKKTYVLPKRRFNSEFLLNSPGELLAAGTYEKLDEIARHDISSACRCLLFGEATAAAFHILRATESVLKSYYFLHKKTKRLAKPMWGPMLEQLRAKTKKKPPSALLDSLDLIRKAYRNPTQHPEAIYQIDSAQDLFGVCLDVIGKMGNELC